MRPHVVVMPAIKVNRVKPIFHQNGNGFALEADVGLDPQTRAFHLAYQHVGIQKALWTQCKPQQTQRKPQQTKCEPQCTQCKAQHEINGIGSGINLIIVPVIVNLNASSYTCQLSLIHADYHLCWLLVIPCASLYQLSYVPVISYQTCQLSVIIPAGYQLTHMQLTIFEYNS